MRRAIGLVAVLATVSCAVDPVGPQTEYDGVKYSATPTNVPIIGFVVLVKMENMTTAVLTRSFPAGCGVRIRLYRPIDGRLVYDETRWPCDYTTPVTITLQPRASSQLTSGGRNSPLGDSLPAASYIVHAVVRTEGTKHVEVDAGTFGFGIAAMPLIRRGSALAVSFMPGGSGHDPLRGVAN